MAIKVVAQGTEGEASDFYAFDVDGRVYDNTNDQWVDWSTLSSLSDAQIPAREAGATGAFHGILPNRTGLFQLRKNAGTIGNATLRHSDSISGNDQAVIDKEASTRTPLPKPGGRV